MFTSQVYHFERPLSGNLAGWVLGLTSLYMTKMISDKLMVIAVNYTRQAITVIRPLHSVTSINLLAPVVVHSYIGDSSMYPLFPSARLTPIRGNRGSA